MNQEAVLPVVDCVHQVLGADGVSSHIQPVVGLGLVGVVINVDERVALLDLC